MYLMYFSKMTTPPLCNVKRIRTSLWHAATSAISGKECNSCDDFIEAINAGRIKIGYCVFVIFMSTWQMTGNKTLFDFRQAILQNERNQCKKRRREINLRGITIWRVQCGKLRFYFEAMLANALKMT